MAREKGINSHFDPLPMAAFCCCLFWSISKHRNRLDFELHIEASGVKHLNQSCRKSIVMGEFLALLYRWFSLTPPMQLHQRIPGLYSPSGGKRSRWPHLA